MMASVLGLCWAEKSTRPMSKPTTAIRAPTASSLRSGESESHQEPEIMAGSWRDADFPFGVEPLLCPLPCEGASVLPFGFPFDLDGEEGVLSGMAVESIAQMVCFSFRLRSGEAR